MRRKLQIAFAGALFTAVGSALTFLPGDAQAAVNQYKINANSPKPAACQNHGTIAPGTWLQNKVCGYYVGTAMAGSTFDVHDSAQSDYHYGRSNGNNNLCAWIPPGALSGNPTGTANESCSQEVRERIGHRRAIGSDFNAKAHEAADGSPITVDPACGGGAYWNYFSSSEYKDGALRDPAGQPGTQVQYRYTANGSNPAIVIRDSNLGWAFMDRDCVTDWRGMKFHNDDD